MERGNTFSDPPAPLATPIRKLKFISSPCVNVSPQSRAMQTRFADSAEPTPISSLRQSLNCRHNPSFAVSKSLSSVGRRFAASYLAGKLMPVTIKILSEKLGLSRSTVSKALNARYDVAAATRERVVQAANELGYQPSTAAAHRQDRPGRQLPDSPDQRFSGRADTGHFDRS